LARCDAHGFHKLFKQYFAGMNFVKQRIRHGHSKWTQSVVIHNFHTVRTIVMPGKADAPLVVDADAVLAFSITF